MLCQDCPKKALCSSLCPEAELYASQDEIPQRELTKSKIRYGKWPELRRPHPKLTPKETLLVELMLKSKTYQECAQILNIKTQTVYSMLDRIKKKL